MKIAYKVGWLVGLFLLMAEIGSASAATLPQKGVPVPVTAQVSATTPKQAAKLMKGYPGRTCRRCTRVNGKLSCKAYRCRE